MIPIDSYMGKEAKTTRDQLTCPGDEFKIHLTCFDLADITKRRG
jgi:hypothetical protein